MKHIKFLLIIMLILNLIISIILGIESKHIREELVNIKLAEEVEDFSKKTENITYITNGNAFNSKYGGNMTSTELSKKISDFMTGLHALSFLWSFIEKNRGLRTLHTIPMMGIAAHFFG